MSKRKTSWPRCPELLKSGEPCNRAVTTENGVPATYCAHHQNFNASEPHPVSGTLDSDSEESAGSSSPTDTEPAASALIPPVVDAQAQPEAEETTESTPIASIRAALRGGLLTSETAEAIVDLILEALRATKSVYASCPSCGKRHPVSLPDLGSRVNAASQLLEQLEGRLKQEAVSADERAAAISSKAQDDLGSLTDDELALLLRAENGETYDFKSDVAALARKVLAGTP